MSELVTELIEVGVIHHHPENPRKDLGDLSELTESIKKNGIMQNLTIIPGWTDSQGKKYKSGYTLLIGHRRYEAAKEAGLKEVPCRVIQDLSDREQLSIMLEENMQRSDLTAWEQAQGFQMMLDLGETVDTLADKTGFSKSTIYHRVNMAKLDMDRLKECENDKSFQLTFDCLYELEKIKDIEERNRILKEANNAQEISWKVNRAVQEQKKEEAITKLIARVKELGLEEADKEIGDNWWSHNKEYDELFKLDNFYIKGNVEIPEEVIDRLDDTCLYSLSLYYFRIIRPKTEEDEIEEEKTEEEIKLEAAKAQRDNIKEYLNKEYQKICESILDFGKEIATKKTTVSKNSELQAATEIFAYMEEVDMSLDLTSTYERYLPDYDIGADEDGTEILKQIDALGLPLCSRMALQLVDDIYSGGWVVGWRYEYDTPDRVIKTIELLGWFSFTISGEQKAILDGTDEQYKRLEELNEEIKNYG